MESRYDDRGRTVGVGNDVMSRSVAIAKVDEIAVGNGKAFEVGEKRIAVFNVEESFYAIDDACPHAGASLAEGYLKDGNVGCPWHYAEFDLTTGDHHHAPATCGVSVYPVVVEGNQIKVTIA